MSEKIPDGFVSTSEFIRQIGLPVSGAWISKALGINPEIDTGSGAKCWHEYQVWNTLVTLREFIDLQMLRKNLNDFLAAQEVSLALWKSEDPDGRWFCSREGGPSFTGSGATPGEATDAWQEKESEEAKRIRDGFKGIRLLDIPPDIAEWLERQK